MNEQIALLPALVRDAGASWPDRARALVASPAVVRARPAILVAAAIIAVLAVGMMLRSPDWRPLYGEMSDGDKSAVLAALQGGNYAARIDPDTGSVEVAAGDVAAARILLAGQGLPKSAMAIDPVGDMPLGLSRAVEAARLKNAASSELAASIEAIDGVKRATVHIALPEPSVFVRDKAPASASVFVTLAPGRVLGEAQVRAIVWLVSSSVAGLAADKVSVVDQSGALLSAGTSAGEAQQLGYQVKLESMVRERLFKLLTPLIGGGKFTAEVAADVDYSQSEASSERYARDGAVLRSEAASRALDSSPAPARGIPGALSNTAPAAAQLTATPPVAQTAAVAASAPVVTSETTNRAWEIGKDVSVTRGTVPRLRRLSVAVVIDKGALGGAQDLAALTRIVRGAVGYDAARGDVVEVQTRRFAVPAAEPAPAWYEAPAVRDYAPWGVVAIVVLVGGIAAFVVMRRRRLAAAAIVPAIVDGGDLAPVADQAIDYSVKLGTTRGLVHDDADRATAVARQMLAAAT
ncbi:flagellar M-ring protein [Polymorphobacter glacialis]|uniref:Flagellar M-ring protein n=1 Tax=Sandarakinorhabdus glacialis TaxID=1614636 RepID=A0A917A135_9SPHN|nr:flagellar basal-body MS-ring/collar protein FliF [Polymorphobacter glacialis]GGE20700.1 flagellar M-ring protein [Polymorphobacter glacialis]